MIRRKVKGVLAVLLASAVLAGCGKQPGGSESAVGSGTEDASSYVQTLRPRSRRRVILRKAVML